jgi:hypothetical protein
VGGRDVRAVADDRCGNFLLEPGSEKGGHESWGLFGRPVTYAGERDEIGVDQVAAELGRGVDGNRTVAISPEHEAGSFEVAAQGSAQFGHVVMPGLEEAEQVVDGAGGAEVVAIGLEALGSVPALWAGHAAEADHLKPLRQPGHAVGEELARAREIEADEGVSLAEVGMRGRDENQGADGLAMIGGQAHGNCSAMGVAEDNGAAQVQLGENAADLISGGGEAGVDVVTTLGLTRAGEIEGDDVLAGFELLHEGDEGCGAAHESVDEDEGGLILHHRSLFEIRKAKAIELKMMALHHDCGVHILVPVQLKETC